MAIVLKLIFEFFFFEKLNEMKREETRRFLTWKVIEKKLWLT